jgi:superfamily I DNA/RNA helicase
MTERLLALTQIREDIWGADSRMWTWQDVERWTDPLEAKKLFERGAKSQIMSAAREMGVTEADLSKLAQLMRGDALDHAFQGDVNWWYDNLLSRQKKVADFPVKVFNKHGAKALIDDPQVIIGTIHSVKGGQADVVYMFPDISPSGMRQWLGRPAERDGIIRQMYVGITRAKEHLILCAPASRNNVDMVRHMRPGR